MAAGRSVSAIANNGRVECIEAQGDSEGGFFAPDDRSVGTVGGSSADAFVRGRLARRNETSGRGPLTGAQAEDTSSGWDKSHDHSIRCSNRGWGLGYPSSQLSRDGDRSEVVAASQFGVSENESRDQGERNQENQNDG